MLDYDPATGIFRWRHRADRSKRWNTKYAGTKAGTLPPTGYRQVQIGTGVPISTARLAWFYQTGEWPSKQIDHINGVRSDDSFANLRQADNAQNNQNRTVQSNNKLGVRGVYRHLHLFRSRICVRGKKYEIGCFPTLEEAAEARRKAELFHHGDYAPTEGTAHGTYKKITSKMT
jgi:hypothetical protein